MSFRRSFVGVSVLAAIVASCTAAPLPQAAHPDPADPQAPTPAEPYRSVLAGTASHAPVPLKSWRELNRGVAPGAGRSP